MTTTRPRRSRTASSRISIQINRPHADTQNCITTGDLVSKDSEPRDSVPSLPRSNDLGLEDEAGLGPVTVPLVTSGSKTDAMSMSNGSTDFNDIISDSDSSIDEDDAHDLFKSFIDSMWIPPFSFCKISLTSLSCSKISRTSLSCCNLNLYMCQSYCSAHPLAGPLAGY